MTKGIEDNKDFKEYHGQDGYTPQKGIDYGTEEDKQIIVAEVQEEFNGELSEKVDKEEGKGLSTNDFTNLLKEKLENLENYNDTEIRNLLNVSLKNVNYTASNGILTFTKNDGSTVSVDLPLELLIESGRYDEANSQIVLVLANGNSINIPVSSLLDDFYGKSETYNKTEVDNIIAEKQALIDKLEEENSTQTERIETLEKENVNQAEELETLWKDYKEKEVEGETVSIADGIWKPKPTINGNSYQETTEGYNLIPTDINAWEQGTISSQNGSHTPTNDDNKRIRTKTFYPISISEHICYLENTEDNAIGNIHYYDSDKTWITSQNAIDGGSPYTELIFTPPANTAFFQAMIMKYNKTDLITPQDIATMKPMLIKGNTKKTYEPYTKGVATPNPNHKQDIEEIEAYNKFNKDEVTENKYINNLGEILDSGYFSISSPIPVISGGNITYKGLTNVGNNVYSSFYNENDEVVETFKQEMGVNTKSVPSNATYVIFSIRMGIDVYAEDKETFQVVNGTKDLPYLPYGHIGLVQRGKNRLPSGVITNETKNGVNFTCDGNGKYTIKGNSSNEAVIFINLKESIILPKDKPLYVHIRNNVTGNIGLGFSELNYEPSCNSINRIATSEKLNSGNKITNIYLKVPANTTVNMELEPSIEDDDTATTYEPYIEPIVHEINLAGEKLAKVGEIADLLNIGVDGSCEIKKRNKANDLSVIQKWLRTSTTKGDYYFYSNESISNVKKPSATTEIANIMSDKFKAVSTSSTGVYGGNEGIGINTNGRIAIYSDETKSMTTDEFKAWVLEKQIEVLYSLETSETIPLPSIEPIKLIEGITNVFELETNLGTTMKVEYKVSNKSRLEALEQAFLLKA